eukprot:TRINITY_DN1884_c0_g1_i1.p1 TRINITY_DN1884_c0_g1~~TRINITY_DN1884_c0_g1_i1.p1  ORF type:complete len:429 (+),score=50.63 TRINITY_DN1884_c0_g1_i1:87-1373(+)
MTERGRRKSLGELVEDQVCNSCHGELNKCILLFCGHTACLNCLARKIVSRHTAGREIEQVNCPLCDQITKLSFMAAIALEAFFAAESSLVSMEDSLIFEADNGNSGQKQNPFESKRFGQKQERPSDSTTDFSSKSTQLRLHLERKLAELTPLISKGEARLEFFGSLETEARKTIDESFRELNEILAKQHIDMIAKFETICRSQRTRIQKEFEDVFEVSKRLTELRTILNERVIDSKGGMQMESEISMLAERISGMQYQSDKIVLDATPLPLESIERVKRAISSLTIRVDAPRKHFSMFLEQRQMTQTSRDPSRSVPNKDKSYFQEQSRLLPREMESFSSNFGIIDGELRFLRSKFTKVNTPILATNRVNQIVTPKVSSFNRDNSISHLTRKTTPIRAHQLETHTSPSSRIDPVLEILQIQRRRYHSKK